jgi:hypothetical protein
MRGFLENGNAHTDKSNAECRGGKNNKDSPRSLGSTTTAASHLSPHARRELSPLGHAVYIVVPELVVCHLLSRSEFDTL